MGMRSEFRAHTNRANATQHAPYCTCSPIRWAAPALEDLDPVDLPCQAFVSTPQHTEAAPQPRLSRQVSTWDWSRVGGRRQRRRAA